MLYFTLVWTGLCLACLTVGCGLLHCLRAERVRRWSDRIILSVWLGLGVIAVLLLAIALVVPLTPLVGMITILVALLAALQVKAARLELADWGQQLKGHAWWKAAVLYGLCCIVSALFSSQQVTWLDTGLYHYGFVHWFAEYGVTPGLALLNQQFGFVSAWFALLAPFNPSALAGGASALMNGFGLLLTLLQSTIVLRIWKFSPGRRKSVSSESVSSDMSETPVPDISEPDWFLAIFSLISVLLLTQTPFLSTVTVSASPDAAVALFTVIVAWSMYLLSTSIPIANLSSRRPSRLLTADIIPLVLAIAAVSLKLTALPLLLITVGYYWAQQPGLLRAVFVSSFAIVGLLPLFSAQILTSGCPLYPSTVACFDLPWTQSTQLIQELAAQTHGWENWFGQPPAVANRQLWLFLKWLNSNQSSKLVVVLAVFSVLAGAYLLWRCKPRLHDALLWLVALSWLGITFMLLKAPLFRFGMGSILLIPVFTAATLCTQAARKWPFFKEGKWLSLPLLVISLSLATLLHSFNYSSLDKRLIVPPSLPTVKTHIQYVNDITYVITQNNRGQCWSASLPCVSRVRPDVVLRNPAAGIAGGFVHNEQTDTPEK
ncbi:MAG: hypothetical protein AAGJ69_08480 [Cyanobacteria bacterium J06559_1]